MGDFEFLVPEIKKPPEITGLKKEYFLFLVPAKANYSRNPAAVSKSSRPTRSAAAWRAYKVKPRISIHILSVIIRYKQHDLIIQRLADHMRCALPVCLSEKEKIYEHICFYN